MSFRGAAIENFKQFTELTIQGIPDTARLIMLVGPNGSGKSSLLDALSLWSSFNNVGIDPSKSVTWQMDYHNKFVSLRSLRPEVRRIMESWEEADHEERYRDTRGQIGQRVVYVGDKSVYVRSPYRNYATSQVRQFGRTAKPSDVSESGRMIDSDVTVTRNYERLFHMATAEIFGPPDKPLASTGSWTHVIDDVRNALSRLFPNVRFEGMENPLQDGTFLFSKGVSDGIPFKNLSSGEKAVFDLILDLAVTAREAEDKGVLFCIDEPDSHMHAKLQAELLSMLYELTPENCQLMLATHSIGMMRRARDIEAKNPGSVIFLDFGGRDFDQPQVIEPIVPDRGFWNSAYEIALDDLAALVAPERVVICEGEPPVGHHSSGHSFDAKCYDSIFHREFPGTSFVSMGSDRQIIGDQRGLSDALGLLIGGLEVVRLVDRDARSSEEASDLADKGVRVLSRRNLESYLFDDEVLAALTEWAGKPDKKEELLANKHSILAARNADPPDDLKLASGQIYNVCKSTLRLANPGNNAKAFMRDTLAPLIEPGMLVYADLKRDIFASEAGS